MAFMDAIPGKPCLKKEEAASGDVSGIIGITGDAIGSLALSFSEKCICKIVSNMLGEEHHEVTRDILDAVGELTNMVSGASRTQLEKMGMAVYAAIPTVVHGQGHTITHILKSPSILIPFSTAAGPFFIDVCIKTTEAGEKSIAAHGVVGARSAQDPSPSPPSEARAPAQASPGAADVRRPATGAPSGGRRSAPAGQAATHAPQRTQRFSRRRIAGSNAWPSGLWQKAQESGQPLRNTVVRSPGPSCTAKRFMSKTMPMRATIQNGDGDAQ
jgi:chemotaxis protein CheX